MSLIIPGSTTTTATGDHVVELTLTGPDGVLVREFVTLIATGFSANVISSSRGGVEIINFGYLYADATRAVSLIGSFNSFLNTGTVAAGSGSALSMASGSDNSIENSGQLFGGMNLQISVSFITNSGEVIAQNTGIFLLGDDNTLMNSGLVTTTSGFGTSAISSDGGGFSLNNSGEIQAGGSEETSIPGILQGAAIQLGGDAGEVNTIINTGVIANAGYAINTGRVQGDIVPVEVFADANDTVVNLGSILGDIRLGDGDDQLDLRGGAFSGVVEMGEGDDLIWTDRSDYVFIEAKSAGMDEVRSTVDFTLAAEIENLTLIGDEAVLAAGNNAANVLTGNAAGNLMFGMGGKDDLFGFEGDDMLAGRNGNDDLYGGNGADDLRGAKGNDELFGGDGDDILRGGDGDDEISGGGGFDIFSFRGLWGQDRVNDFVIGEDLVDLSGTSADRFGDLNINVQASRTVIRIGSDKVFLEGVTDPISADDFIF